MIRRRYRVVERIVDAPHLRAIVSRHWTRWGVEYAADVAAWESERDGLPIETVIEVTS